MASSNVAEAAALAREAREIGWLKAHVHVGRSYPLVAVRVSRSALRGGGVVSTLDTEDQTVLAIATGAITLARRLDELGVALSVLELDTTVAGADGADSVRVSLSGDVPPELGEAEIARLAGSVVGERLGDEVQVHVVGLGDAAEAQRVPSPSEATREERREAEIAPEPFREEPEEIPSEPVREQLEELPSPPPRVETYEADGAYTDFSSEPPLEVEEEAEQSPARAGRGRGGQLFWAGIAILALVLVMLIGVRLPAQQDLIIVEQRAATAVAGPEAPLTVSAPAPTAVPTTVSAPAPTTVNAPAPTAVPTVVAPVATQPPAPTSTVVPTAAPTAAPVQAPLLDFAAGQGASPSWPSNPQGVAFFDTDGYHLAARNAGQFVAVGLPTRPASGNYAVNGTFHKVSGPVGGGYGLILGDSGTPPLDGISQAGSYFVFEVGDKGEVGAWRRDGDQWVDILAWTPMPTIKSGTGENQLSVRIDGGQASFSVNGAEVPLPSRPQVSPGGIGVFLGGDGNQAVLTRLTVTEAGQ